MMINDAGAEATAMTTTMMRSYDDMMIAPMVTKRIMVVVAAGIAIQR